MDTVVNMGNFISTTVASNKKKLAQFLRNKALKNLEAECILRDVDMAAISEDKLEVLIRNEEDKIKSKYKTNSIVLLLIALGLHA